MREGRDRLVLALFIAVIVLVVLAVSGIVWIESGHWIGDPCHDDPQCGA
jgi:hypothetical protein